MNFKRRKYYYNVKTKESSWTIPKVIKEIRDQLAKEREIKFEEL